jgi:hypothetical protein
MPPAGALTNRIDGLGALVAQHPIFGRLPTATLVGTSIQFVRW